MINKWVYFPLPQTRVTPHDLVHRIRYNSYAYNNLLYLVEFILLAQNLISSVVYHLFIYIYVYVCVRVDVTSHVRSITCKTQHALMQKTWFGPRHSLWEWVHL